MDRIGIHVEARGEKAVAPIERLVGEIAPALGMNRVIAQIDNAYQYLSHPEVAEPEPMTAESARRLARIARENGIELVPMYNCLGHQSWGPNTGGLLRAHPEFNEAPDLDPTAEDFYCMSWCPNHPDVNPLVFDLFDELLDAFGPTAFHVGMDEVFIIGHCPRCKGA
ncbi:MAG: family 20 glycosylhydrolase, partial [Gemmatimonadales bacterium]|nr:family 20 glycosylhydrolase [Gemmatimonadales bacterium]